MLLCAVTLCEHIIHNNNISSDPVPFLWNLENDLIKALIECNLFTFMYIFVFLSDCFKHANIGTHHICLSCMRQENINLLVVSEREKAAMACRLSVSVTRSYY